MTSIVIKTHRRRVRGFAVSWGRDYRIEEDRLYPGYKIECAWRMVQNEHGPGHRFLRSFRIKLFEGWHRLIVAQRITHA